MPLQLSVDPVLRQRIIEEAGARGVPTTWFLERLILDGLERLAPAEEFRLTRD